MTTPTHLPLLAVWLDKLLSALVILLTGAHAQPLPQLRERTAAGRIYYANHNSHGDFTEKEDFLAFAQATLLAQQPVLRQEERGL